MLVGWAGSHPCCANTSWAFFFLFFSFFPPSPLSFKKIFTDRA